MTVLPGNKTTEMPNLLLIAGNGRNVGKTFLACKIIRRLAQKEDVIGLKISPHFHTFNKNNVIFRNNKFVVIEEKEFGTKDSALMLEAGAKQVFYIMAKKEDLHAALLPLKNILIKNPVVCESGGLHEIVLPGIFLFVKRTGEEIVKTQFQKYNPVVVNNNGQDFDFDVKNIDFRNNVFRLKK